MAGRTLLTNTPEKLLKQYYQTLIDHKIKVDKLIIFGSYAKNSAKDWSDLDVCVVSSQFGKNNFEDGVLLQQLATSIDPMIQPHPFHPDDFHDKWNVFASEILKYGQEIPRP